MFLKELKELYVTFTNNEKYNLQPLASSYKEYVLSEMESKKDAGALDFWLSELNDARIPDILDVPQEKTLFFFVYEEDIDIKLHNEIQHIASTLNVSIKSIYFACYVVLLRMISSSNKFMAGIVTSNRPPVKDSEKVLGCFLNTLPLNIECKNNVTWKELICYIHDKIAETAKYQHVSLSEISEYVKKNTGQSPNLGTNYFNYVDFYEIEEYRHAIVSTENSLVENELKKYNIENSDALLQLTLSKRSDSVKFILHYASNIFKGIDLGQLFGYYMKALRYIVSDPDNVFEKQRILSKIELEKIKNEWSSRQLIFDKTQSVPEILDSLAKKYGKKSALEFENQSISYNLLRNRTNKLANFLSLYISGEDRTVGILLERGIPMIECIISIWKSSAAYIPLDVHYPIERVVTILNSSASPVLLSQSSYITKELQDSYTGTIIELDTIGQLIEAQSQEYNARQRDIHGLAYVIYTSGSTGVPKGAMVEHLGMMNHLYAKIEDLYINEGSIIAQNSSHTFDISIWQMFAALLKGGKTIIYPNEQVLNPDHFIQKIKEDTITILEVVPSYLSVLQGMFTSEITFPCLKYLLVTGETVKPVQIKKWFETFPNIPVVNAYGPTEASDDITHHIMTCFSGEEQIPIGKPLPNLNIYIVDETMQLCPIGIKGEICVSGIGVGRGYLNDVARTQEIFVTDPFIDDQQIRMYKTGDIGSWGHGGEINFYGRKDYQVKIRGFRIELKEIEHALSKYEKIKQIVVIDRVDAHKNKYLAAYYVSDYEIDKKKIIAYLSGYLPEYMHPDYFIKINEIPLNINGKTDRKALPEPQLETNDVLEKPQTGTEKQIASIWADVLKINIDAIYRTSNFFDLGGNSLKTMTIINKINKFYGTSLKFSDLFSNPNLMKISRKVNTAIKDVNYVICPVNNKAFYNLSSQQQSLFFIQQIDPTSTAYNMPIVLELKNKLKFEDIELSFKKLIEIHPVLRTSFHTRNGVPVQKVETNFTFSIQKIELESVDNMDFLIKPFDLSKIPLIRVTYIMDNRGNEYLLVDLHHIVSDGISNNILIRDFIKILEKNELSNNSIEYKDYSEWQNSDSGQRILMNQEKFWLTKLNGITENISYLPYDYKRPDKNTYEGSTMEYVITKGILDKVYIYVKETNVTLFSFLIGVYSLLLYKISGRETIIIGSPVSGRTNDDLNNIVGMFANTLLFRFDISSETFISNYFQMVYNYSVEFLDNQDYPFEQLVEKVSFKRRFNRNPLFDTLLVLQNMEFAGNIASDYFKVLEIERKTSKFDLSLICNEERGQLFIEFEYNIKLFKNETIQRLSVFFGNLISQVIESPMQQIKSLKLQSDELITFNLENIDDYDF
jgi:amino acid adenylation domain-containing protein